MQKDPATKPLHHDYWACIPVPAHGNHWAHAPGAHALQQEKAPQREARTPELKSNSHSPQLEKSPRAAAKTQHSHN